MSENLVKTKNYKQIVVDNTNYNKLKSLGNAGDSFNDVLTKILSNSAEHDIPKT